MKLCGHFEHKVPAFSWERITFLKIKIFSDVVTTRQHAPGKTMMFANVFVESKTGLLVRTNHRNVPFSLVSVKTMDWNVFTQFVSGGLRVCKETNKTSLCFSSQVLPGDLLRSNASSNRLHWSTLRDPTLSENVRFSVHSLQNGKAALIPRQWNEHVRTVHREPPPAHLGCRPQNSHPILEQWVNIFIRELRAQRFEKECRSQTK